MTKSIIIVTKEMMEALNYDEETTIKENPDKLNSVNNLKNNTEIYEWVFDIPKLSREAATTLIKNHINKLSSIESEQNCYPEYVVLKNIENALKLVGKMVVESNHSDKMKSNTKPKVFLTATSEISLLTVTRTLLSSFESQWSQISVILDEPRKEFIKFLLIDIMKAKLLKQTLFTEKISNISSFCSMFIFKQSDLNSAIYNLTESFNDPTSSWKIGYIYVQESCFEEFLTILKEKLRPYPNEILRDQKFINDYKEAQKIIKKYKIPTILPQPENNEIDTKEYFPIICNEFDRDYFSVSARFAFSVTIKPFRTTKEAIELARKDDSHVSSIWCMNHSLSYEIVNSLNQSVFWLNCLGKLDVGLPIKIGDFTKAGGQKFESIYGNSGVHIKNSYHYEYFLCKDDKTSEIFYKTVIFPIGVTFSN